MYFLVRHAEKVLQGDDPMLSPAGKLRAEALSSLLADAGIERIHSTDFNRTRHTVEPLAQRLGLAVELYDPSRPDDLLTNLQKTGGRQLIVGHSNTVPDLVQRLGGNGGTVIDEAGEYDRLYLRHGRWKRCCNNRSAALRETLQSLKYRAFCSDTASSTSPRNWGSRLKRYSQSLTS